MHDLIAIMGVEGVGVAIRRQKSMLVEEKGGGPSAGNTSLTRGENMWPSVLESHDLDIWTWAN
jgi:hypothetical protein